MDPAQRTSYWKTRLRPRVSFFEEQENGGARERETERQRETDRYTYLYISYRRYEKIVNPCENRYLEILTSRHTHTGTHFKRLTNSFFPMKHFL